MEMMEQLKLRLDAIAIVIAHQLVITSEQFVNAMKAAVALTEGPGGRWKTIEPAVFGGEENADLYAARVERAALIDEMKMEDKAPKWFRVQFTKEWNRDFVEINEIIEAWNLKTEDFEGVDSIKPRAQKGTLGEKKKA